MIVTGKLLRGLHLHATDGDIGHVDDVLFDDRDWTVRWLVADTGRWLPGRQVLIPPQLCGTPNAEALPVDMTREQITEQPSLDADAPISLQYERQLLDYFGVQPYGFWYGTGVGTATPTAYPAGMHTGPGWPAYGGDMVSGHNPPTTTGDVSAPSHRIINGAGEEISADDAHRRSNRELNGYHVTAADNEHIGHIQQLYIDTAHWHLPLLMVDTRDWWYGGDKIILPTKQVAVIDYLEGAVHMQMDSEAIRHGPAAPKEAEMLSEQYLHEVLHMV